MAALTQKQEEFCRKYVETGNASEAYRQAYNPKGKPETVGRSAHELFGNPKIAAKIAELRGQLERTHNVTVASLIAELEEARQVAKGREQGAAMVQATLGKAKLAGIDSGDDGDEGAEPVRVEVSVVDGRKHAEPDETTS